MKIKRIAFLLPVFILFLSQVSLAKYSQPVVSKIPLYRLVINLEAQKEKQPKNAQVYYALGRLYSMVYSKKTDTVEAIIRKGDEDYYPYYGYQNLNHFFPVKPLKDTTRKSFYEECLNRAVENFKASLRLDTNFVPSLLGLAWILDQRGDTAEAVTRYRQIVKLSPKTTPDFSTLETAEAASYLVKLLNPEKNKKELENLTKRLADYKPTYMISPILVPLEDNTSFQELIDTSARVQFDLDGSGIKNDWEWTSHKSAWLVYLPQNKKVENAFQLFGNVSFNIFWPNGFEALKTLDDNQNGLIDGSELRNLALWEDKNANGISESDELHSLSDMKISGLEYNYIQKQERVLASATGVHFSNGTTRASYDWFPKLKKVKSL